MLSDQLRKWVKLQSHREFEFHASKPVWYITSTKWYSQFSPSGGFLFTLAKGWNSNTESILPQRKFHRKSRFSDWKTGVRWSIVLLLLNILLPLDSLFQKGVTDLPILTKIKWTKVYNVLLIVICWLFSEVKKKVIVGVPFGDHVILFAQKVAKLMVEAVKRDETTSRGC